jgi:hypothetical protein
MGSDAESSADPQAIDGFDARKLPFIETLFKYANASRPTFEFHDYGTPPAEQTEIPESEQHRFEAYHIDVDIDLEWMAPKDWITPIEDFERVLKQALELTVVEVFSLVKYAWDPDSFDFSEELKDMLGCIERGAEYESLVDIYLIDEVDPADLETVDLGGVVVPAEPPDVQTKAKHSYVTVDPSVIVDGTSISIDAQAIYQR